MHYYNPNDRSPRWWAVGALVLYVLVLTASFVWVSFDQQPVKAVYQDMILIDFTEPEPASVEPARDVRNEPRRHEVAAPKEQTAQVSGKDPVTQTPNPKAMFHMNKGGADEPDNAGNPQAPQGEDKASGTGPGLSVDGLDQLDRGLQGRGLRGELPKPTYPGNKSGKIIVRVTVGPAGDVTSAAYEPKGSTENDPALINAALAAARNAKFTESHAPVQGGTITYEFNLNYD